MKTFLISVLAITALNVYAQVSDTSVEIFPLKPYKTAKFETPEKDIIINLELLKKPAKDRYSITLGYVKDITICNLKSCKTKSFNKNELQISTPSINWASFSAQIENIEVKATICSAFSKSMCQNNDMALGLSVLETPNFYPDPINVYFLNLTK
ncbi:MAG: hypothetical protein PHC75_05190 [Burkholderiales bacterium]|nr:hypothetical protein [Burkholderiales bacterium]